jgi:hypothetical protein
MKTFLLAPLILAVFGAAPAFAGGRPVMYVVVDRVETTQDQSSISMIRIWGSFTRDNPGRDNFSKPIDGYIQFGRGSDKEAPKWQKAAGTGKAVLVGCCGGAGPFETVVIHPANEKPKDGGETIPYPTGHLELFGDMFAGGRDDYRPEVKTLLAFVAAKQKVCPLCGGAAYIVARNPGHHMTLAVRKTLLGKWNIAMENAYKGEWKFNVDGTVDSSTNGAKAGKWTIDLSKKQVLIKWNSDAADKLDLPLDPKSTTGSQVGRNNYKLEAVKVP